MKGGKLSVNQTQRFIDASYKPINDTPQKINSYILDYDLSDDFVKVYSNANNKRAIVIHRGTVPSYTNDLLTDLKITLGKDDERIKHGEDIQQKANLKYGAKNVSILGHSLGAYIGEKVLRPNNKEGILISKPVVPKTLLNKSLPNQYEIRSSLDPVSILKPFQKDKSNIVIPATTYNPLTEHSYKVLERLPKNLLVGYGYKTEMEGIRENLKTLYNKMINMITKDNINKEKQKKLKNIIDNNFDTLNKVLDEYNIYILLSKENEKIIKEMEEFILKAKKISLPHTKILKVPELPKLPSKNERIISQMGDFILKAKKARLPHTKILKVPEMPNIDIQPKAPEEGVVYKSIADLQKRHPYYVIQGNIIKQRIKLMGAKKKENNKLIEKEQKIYDNLVEEFKKYEKPNISKFNEELKERKKREREEKKMMKKKEVAPEEVKITRNLVINKLSTLKGKKNKMMKNLEHNKKLTDEEKKDINKTLQQINNDIEHWKNEFRKF